MAAEAGKRRAGDAKSGTPTSSTPTVGGYVDASCGKCKAITSHIVLAKVGVKPTRVECRTCHAMHAYRSSPSSRAPSTKSPAQTPHEAWTDAMRHARGAGVQYVPSGRYVTGERLKHATFGEGVVARLASATVCEVVFATGTVKLIMGATQSRAGS